MIKRTTEHSRECRLADHMQSSSEGDIVFSKTIKRKKKNAENNFSQKKGN